MLLASNLFGAGRGPVLSMLMPRISCEANNLLTGPSAKIRVTTSTIVAKCSSQVVLAMRMSSSQLNTPSNRPNADFTVRESAEGGTVNPKATLENSYSNRSASLKAGFWRSFSAISIW